MNWNPKAYDGGFIVPVVVTILFALAVIFLMLWGVFGGSAKGADNDVPCMTQTQARAKWPNDHLYYHGVDHCWDNVRAYARPDRTRKSGKGLPADTNGNEIRHKAAADMPVVRPPLPLIYYPTLMSGGGTTDNMLGAGPMTTWPPVIDFDAEPVPFLPWRRASDLINQ